MLISPSWIEDGLWLRKKVSLSSMPNRILEYPPKLHDIIGGTIVKVMIGTIPNVFCWVEFRGICRKPLHLNPRMLGQEFVHFFAPVNGGPIPQKNQRAAKMFQQIFQKSSHIQPIQIPFAELDDGFIRFLHIKV